MLRVEDFRYIVDDKVLADLYARARRLYNKHVVNINSTYQGGGVAELLSSLIPLMNDVGITTGWRILHGSPDFFEITKEFHNGLQGGDIHLSERKKDLYLQVNENFSTFTHINHDVVVVHDPQPLPLIQFYTKNQPWIWRCHIDITDPNPQLWEYLKGFLLKYDQVLISSPKYAKEDLPVPQRIVMPAINPLSLKNRDLPPQLISDFMDKVGIPKDKPIIAQISRLDPWKDPEGVIDVFQRVKQQYDCRLVLCYNMATDDPEGLEMYNKVYAQAKAGVERGDIIMVGISNDTLVNSLQRFATVIIQKSIREGFCLAVTEALWKGTPVVASNVGGIPLQITDGENGYLLDPHDNQGFADRIVHILKNRSELEEMGHKARETVREKFLMTRLLSDYLDLLNSIRFQ